MMGEVGLVKSWSLLRPRGVVRGNAGPLELLQVAAIAEQPQKGQEELLGRVPRYLIFSPLLILSN